MKIKWIMFIRCLGQCLARCGHSVNSISYYCYLKSKVLTFFVELFLQQR